MKIKKIPKKEIEEKIREIFLKNPSYKELKKAKKLAMSKNIKLRKLRKNFCKKCLTFFTSSNSQTRIKTISKRLFKIVRCKNCGYVSRWRIKV